MSGADDRHDDVVHERRDDLAERRADDHADGEVDHVAAHREFFEFFPHRNLRSDFHRVRRGATGAGGISTGQVCTINRRRRCAGRAMRPAVTDTTIYTLRQQTDISLVACRLLTRAPDSVIILSSGCAVNGATGRLRNDMLLPAVLGRGHLKLQGRGDTRGFRMGQEDAREGCVVLLGPRQMHSSCRSESMYRKL